MKTQLRSTRPERMTSPDSGTVLVEAKIGPPTLRPGLVDRPRVTAALAAGHSTALTTVTAPPGYGKSTSIRVWLEKVNAALAWVTLDKGDDDPVRLWRYVATAVDRVRPGLGRGALQRLNGSAGAIEDAVDELMNGIAAYGDHLVVVLDDLHSVTDEDALASIDHALRHLPANARIVAATRIDPAIGLPRLRALSQLTELRAADLAFTNAEAHELLVVRGGVRIGPNEVARLVRRTEGWPAALILAGLWLQHATDPVAAVRDFGGDVRFVADYLSSEVLESLDPRRRSFLEVISVLGEVTPELCDAVLDRTDSAAELEAVEHANLFLTSLGRGHWYRVHALFADYARAQLSARDPDEPSRIHRRAAEWLAGHGLSADAVEHAAAAGEHGLVAEILSGRYLEMIRSGGSRTVLRWARTLPDELLVEDPQLLAGAATASLLVSGAGSETRRLVWLCEVALASDSTPWSGYLEAAMLMVRCATLVEGVERALSDGRHAVELAEKNAGDILPASLAAYARALYLAGDLPSAFLAASRALRYPDVDRRAPSLTHARTTLALVAVGQGRPTAAREYAETARSVVGRIGASRSWLGANASAAIGVVLAAEGELVEAEHEFAVAEHFSRSDIPTLDRAWLLALIADVRLRRGRIDQAEAAFRAAREALDELPDAGVVPAIVERVGQDLEVARARASEGAVLEPLSDAELAVLPLLATDLSIREIGERLFLSPNTIRSHTRSIYHKLNVHSRSEAIARTATLRLLGEAPSPR